MLNAARPIIKENLYRNFTDEDQIIILCNPGGYAVDLISSFKSIQLCFSMGLGLGTCFREEVCGTNAIALAMRLKRMVVIKGDQHYCGYFKTWSCIASPIRSPNGEIIGYLDISMNHEEKIGHALALVQTAVNCIEQKIHKEMLLDEMIPKTIASPETLSRFETLSRREREVFRLMALGETIPKIAKTINVSVDTAKTYQKGVYKKLEIKNKIDCSNKARWLGILDE